MTTFTTKNLPYFDRKQVCWNIWWNSNGFWQIRWNFDELFLERFQWFPTEFQTNSNGIFKTFHRKIFKKIGKSFFPPQVKWRENSIFLIFWRKNPWEFYWEKITFLFTWNIPSEALINFVPCFIFRCSFHKV